MTTSIPADFQDLGNWFLVCLYWILLRSAALSSHRLIQKCTYLKTQPLGKDPAYVLASNAALCIICKVFEYPSGSILLNFMFIIVFIVLREIPQPYYYWNKPKCNLLAQGFKSWLENALIKNNTPESIGEYREVEKLQGSDCYFHETPLILFPSLSSDFYRDNFTNDEVQELGLLNGQIKYGHSRYAEDSVYSATPINHLYLMNVELRNSNCSVVKLSLPRLGQGGTNDIYYFRVMDNRPLEALRKRAGKEIKSNEKDTKGILRKLSQRSEHYKESLDELLSDSGAKDKYKIISYDGELSMALRREAEQLRQSLGR